MGKEEENGICNLAGLVNKVDSVGAQIVDGNLGCVQGEVITPVVLIGPIVNDALNVG